ncbi:hypothetical protein [Corynebacterium ciconiae]|uniref:hypothetical protein n=1 Tax=Corynebacterium ciconiae TaxID=227319 RepID=UPI00142F0167|nr:hypothetical protein [Corynebacterium ciconiae]
MASFTGGESNSIAALVLPRSNCRLAAISRSLWRDSVLDLTNPSAVRNKRTLLLGRPVRQEGAHALRLPGLNREKTHLLLMTGDKHAAEIARLYG